MINLEIYKPWSAKVLAADGAQANLIISPGAIPTGFVLEVVDLLVCAAAANAGATEVKVGFGATTLPASALAGAGKILLEQDVAPEAEIVGTMGQGAPGDELLLTCEAPTGGYITVTYLYRIFQKS
jgi:hypothetical protein